MKMPEIIDNQPSTAENNYATPSASASPKVLDSYNDEDLCCCEYINIKGERSHLLGFCCECDTLDDSFDRLVRRVEVPESHVRDICNVIQDRMRIPWCGGARRIRFLTLTPIGILPILGYLSTFGPMSTCISFLLIPIVLRIVNRYIGNRRASFHYSWSISSLGYSFLVIYYTLSETSWFWHTFNLILFLNILMGIMITKRKGRRDPSLYLDNLPVYYYCRRCGFYINGRDHHCNWLDCCVGLGNRYWFILTISSAILWILGIIYSYYGSTLAKIGFTTELIYTGFSSAIAFSTVIYGTIILLFLLAILAHQLNMACKGVSYLDWKLAASKHTIHR